MRSRWFHVPILHVPRDGVEKKVTWLELFYDLIFVASFIQLGNGLSDQINPAGFLAFAGIFAPLWITWTGFTFFENRFIVDDFTHRLLVFLQMFAVGAMAVTAPAALAGAPMLFLSSFAVAQVVVAALYYRTWRQVPASRDYSAYWGRVFLASALVAAATAWVPPPYWPIGGAVAVLLVLFAPLSKQSRELNQAQPIDQEHLSERYGLLTLIVLGESFVKVLSSLSSSTGPMLILQASMTLLITCCLWWIYFDDVAGSRVRRERFAPVVWLYGHLPLQLGATAVGVGIKKAVHFELMELAPAAYRWLLAGSLALTFLAVAIVDSVTERRHAELSDRLRVNVRLASALLMLLLAPAGAGMSAGMFLALVAAVCVAQVVLDMMMAPLESGPEHAEEHGVTTAELARRAASGQEVRHQRPRIGEALRKGAPAALRRDVYFYFMEGSWKRLLAALSFTYLMVNVFFAALYSLRPGCVANVASDSFGDAFFFSVQTLSTIGFGAMHPVTDYGHGIVTLEAATGMLLVALATGLMFAKASRPQASMLFSNVAVVTQRNAKPVLSFRVGNARGNDVVEAALTVTVLRDELTPEGEHLRRMRDLRLVRDRSPLFTLSWTVMHEIDEASPLNGIDWQQPSRSIAAIIVTMLGHDGTYGQTVYSRHIYGPDDLRVDARFVDVISELPDGRMLIDYTRFHDTEPLDSSP